MDPFDPRRFGAPPDQLNKRVTGAMLTPMIIGQNQLGNSINQDELIPGTYTLQFGFVGVDPDPDTGKINLPTTRAIITWKVDGQQQRRVISIVPGSAISGVCNGVDVKIEDVPIEGRSTNGMRYSVQTTLSRGTRGNTQQPPTLVDSITQSIATLSIEPFDVPEDAGVISVYCLISIGNFSAASAPKVTDFQISFADPAAALLGSTYPLAAGAGWIPLPPGTQQVNVANGTAETAFCQLIWGVEG